MPADPQKQLIDAFTALTNQLTQLNDYHAELNAKKLQSNVMGHEDQTAQALLGAPAASDPAVRNLEALLRAKPIADVSSSTGGVPLSYNRASSDMNAALAALPLQRETPAEQVPAGSLSANASLPDNYQPQSAPTGAPGGSGVPGGFPGLNEPNSPIAWALLGEHGGPAPIRNFALDMAGFQRSLQYAGTNLGAGSAVSNVLTKIPGVTPEAMTSVSNLFNKAANNPMVPYLGYKGIQSLSGANDTLANFQQVGQQFGYGPPAGGQAIFGFRNPLGSMSPAATVGGAMNLQSEALSGTVPGMGFSPFNDMTRAQANQAIQGIASQGFSMNPINPWVSALSAVPGVGGTLAGLLSSILGQKLTGDASTISTGLNKPLYNMFPGLSQGTVDEFDPLLRNSATSVQQLKETLSNLGIEAKATKETLDQITQSIANTGEAFESMGSTPQGGVSLATQFTNATGLDPTIASQMAQNPMMQGLLLGQYGILPSGIGDMNGGAFTNAMTSVVKRMAGGLRGLDVNRYENINGNRVETIAGNKARNDQIGQMLGIPSNIVNRLLGDSTGNTARSNLETLLGTSMNPLQGTLWSFINSGTGRNGKNSEAYKKAMHLWDTGIEPEMHDIGLTPERIKRIDSRTGLRGRANALQNAIATSAKNQHMNQIAGTTGQENKINVTVGLTPAANKLFTLHGGPSANKKISNAGGASISSVVNTPTSDLTNSGYLSGLGNTEAGSIYGSGIIPSSNGTMMP